MSLYVICYALVALQKSTKERKFELYRFKVYLLTFHKIRVRLSADACTRLDKYIMILTVSLARHLTVIVYKV